MEHLQTRIDALRSRLEQPHVDPRSLHDKLQTLLDDIHAEHGHVPADLREAVEELQAEIFEDYYDNMPI